MIKNDCIFCKIAAGEIPSHTLYEDDNFRVILDLSPATKGHCLIIPKNHADNLLELDEETAAKVLPLAKKIAKVYKTTLNYDGFNIIQNNGECAGQSVNHFHMHIIPRFKGDNAVGLWKPNESKDEELAAIEKEFKNQL